MGVHQRPNPIHHLSQHVYQSTALILILVVFILEPGSVSAQILRPPTHSPSVLNWKLRQPTSFLTPRKNTQSGEFTFSTCLGGTETEVIKYSTIDSSGNLIVGTDTTSKDFPTVNAFQPQSLDKKRRGDICLTKFTSTGEVIFSTYLSGSRRENLLDLKIDAQNNIFLLCYTDSPDIPLKNEFSKIGRTLFAKFDPMGKPIFITKFPGGEEVPTIFIDNENNAIVVGSTTDRNFPLVKPFQPYFGNSKEVNYSDEDYTIIKFDPMGRVIYSSYLGGGGLDRAQFFDLNKDGDLTIIGYTNTENFPLKNPFQKRNNGDDDLFITKVSHSGHLIFSTYFGSRGNESSPKVAIDSDENLIILGKAIANGFPIFNQGNLDVPADEYNTYLLKVSPQGKRIFTKLIGGSRIDDPHSLFLDQENNIYFFGISVSPDLPVKNAVQSTLNGISDWMFGKFSADGELQHLSFWGGNGNDQIESVFQAPNGDFVVFKQGVRPLDVLPEVHPLWQSRDIPHIYFAKIDRHGQVTYATLFPSTSDWVIKFDQFSNLVLAGLTTAKDLPVKNATFPKINLGTSNFEGTPDFFITKIDPTGSLLFSTYLGGTQYEQTEHSGKSLLLSLDPLGNIFLLGQTQSIDFPEISPVQEQSPQGTVTEPNFIVSAFDPTGHLLLSTYFGGQSQEQLWIVQTAPQKIFLLGTTASQDFPTVNAVQGYRGAIDGFASLIQIQLQPGN